MSPKDMPDVTADVASVKASHTPDVAEDVVNDSRSHIPAASEDVVNDSHEHSNIIVVGEHDVTENVVNELQSHTIAVQKESEGIELNEKLYTRISKRQLAILSRDAAIGAAIQKKNNSKKCILSPLARRLLGIAMMHAPKLALETGANIIALSTASFLADCGLNSQLHNIAQACPSAATLKNIMLNEAVDTIEIEKKDMRPNALSLLADKGEGENKRNGASFVKLIARYDETRSRVKVTYVGVQSAGNTSIDAAEGIDHALQVYDCSDDRILLSNHGTDAGGGGTREDLLRKLHSVNRVKHFWNTYLLLVHFMD